MKLSKHLIFITEYAGTNYVVYLDSKATSAPKYCLVDYKTNEIVSRANKIEKFEKCVYGV